MDRTKLNMFVRGYIAKASDTTNWHIHLHSDLTLLFRCHIDFIELFGQATLLGELRWHRLSLTRDDHASRYMKKVCGIAGFQAVAKRRKGQK